METVCSTLQTPWMPSGDNRCEAKLPRTQDREVVTERRGGHRQDGGLVEFVWISSCDWVPFF